MKPKFPEMLYVVKTGDSLDDEVIYADRSPEAVMGAAQEPRIEVVTYKRVDNPVMYETVVKPA
jgi:hypothetical protein